MKCLKDCPSGKVLCQAEWPSSGAPTVLSNWWEQPGESVDSVGMLQGILKVQQLGAVS